MISSVSPSITRSTEALYSYKEACEAERQADRDEVQLPHVDAQSSENETDHRDENQHL